jgi:hypothetical protein
MKKKLALAFLLAAAGGAFLFGAGASSLLSPQPPAATAPAQRLSPSATKAHAARVPAAKKPVVGEVLEVRGKILKVYAADKARKRAEWIVVLAGKKRLSVVVYEGTSIRDGKGSRIEPSLLRAGETVTLRYREKGKARTALDIRV